jgi:hypothetical protein
LKQTYASPDEIFSCFVIKGQKPHGLMNIMQEMKLRSEFIDKDSILDGSHYEEAGWLSQKFSQVMGIFGTQQATFDSSKQLVSKVVLESS